MATGIICKSHNKFTMFVSATNLINHYNKQQVYDGRKCH